MSFMLSVTSKPFMLSVIMLNVIMLSVVMVNVVSPSPGASESFLFFVADCVDK